MAEAEDNRDNASHTFFLQTCLSCFCVSSFGRHPSLERDVEDATNLLHLLLELARILEAAARLNCRSTLLLLEVDGEVVPHLVDQHHCLLIEPLHSLPVLPQPILYAVLGAVDVGAESVLLTLVPPAFVPAPICPVVYSISFLLVHVVLPVVPYSICILIYSVALHIIRLPLAVVVSTVLP